eukprot:CAMPEP_0181304942 /NCGR_PEP_ID=MMETSP1101-20121128/9444_1 /TAXON_ID=46948 /ORGANISM="Rhodomonas abbreviata, Strain Caron Lab Isolate" /LENGTH=416 /DNA_ID=CAMNT_0023410783 /DNA_START=298 /DNA_END=1548 /DNA_ORIENTATION=-
MTLATIFSQEDQDIVVSWLLDQDRSGTLQGLVHIGLFRCTLAPPSLQALCTDAGDADEFIWADGTPFVPGTSYEAWADDQPSTATWTLIDPEARRYGISPNNDPGWVMGFADYWGLCESQDTCTHFCRDQLDNCHPNATCATSPGSFTCSCKDGFSGDGVICNPIMQLLPAADGDAANVPFAPLWEGTSGYLYVEGGVNDGQSISILEFEGLPPDTQIVNASLALFKLGDISDEQNCENLFVLNAGFGDVSDERTTAWSYFSPLIEQTVHIPDLGSVHIDVTDMMRSAVARNAGVFSVLLQSTNARCKAAFASKEDAVVDNRPFLTVVYEPCAESGCDVQRRKLAPSSSTQSLPVLSTALRDNACRNSPSALPLVMVCLFSLVAGSALTHLIQHLGRRRSTNGSHEGLKCDGVCCQ